MICAAHQVLVGW